MAARTRMNRPYPRHALEDVISIAETIQQVNGGQPVRTELLADELGISVRSSVFFEKLKSSRGFELTVGSNSDDYVELTPLGESLTAPTSAEERSQALRAAARAPNVFRRFYDLYTGKRMPGDVYAVNALERQLGIRSELTRECLHLLRDNGLFTGIITEHEGVQFVDRANEDPAAAPGRLEGEGPAGEARNRRPEDSGVVVVGVRGDPVVERSTCLLAGLSIVPTSVLIDLSDSALVPEPLPRTLAIARCCVFVWPGAGAAQSQGVSHEEMAAPRLWACLGAAISQVGRRLVVVLADDTDSEILTGLATVDISAVEVTDSIGDLYQRLVASLVESDIIRISVV